MSKHMSSACHYLKKVIMPIGLAVFGLTQNSDIHPTSSFLCAIMAMQGKSSLIQSIYRKQTLSDMRSWLLNSVSPEDPLADIRYQIELSS